MREGWGGMRARLARPDEGVGQRVHQLRAAMIRKKLPEFAKACADDTELDLIHLCWPSREESPCDREKPKHTARRRENPVTESLQKQVAHPKPHLCSRGALKRFLGFARDFGSGLKRPLSASTWVAAFSVCRHGFVSGHAFRRAACDVIDWR